MPIAHTDVLINVPPAEPQHWLTAQSKRNCCELNGGEVTETVEDLLRYLSPALEPFA
jgi:hypothetical protein